MLIHSTPHIDWIRWSIHPSTVIGIAALGSLYFWRARRGHVSAPRKASFVAGLFVLFTCLNGPIHDLSDLYLFSAHMVQHLLLTMLVTPLLIAGTPGWMLQPLLRTRAVFAVARRLTGPGASFAIFNVTLAAWHVPPLYNLAMAHHAVHIVQHLTFLAASTLMWWPLMSQMPELPRLSYPKQMLYTFLMMVPMSLVAILITYADGIIYAAYEKAPRVFGLTPIQDQLLGGLIMWIPGGFVFIGVLTSVFFRWAAVGEDDTVSAQVGYHLSHTSQIS